MIHDTPPPIEHKFNRSPHNIRITDEQIIEGYASFFNIPDKSNDIVQPGAYSQSLSNTLRNNRTIKMLWQHDPAQPIGIWDQVYENERGLYVRGRILPEIAKGAEAIELVKAGAIDGLSIGYRTVKATKNPKGQRLLSELELWEVSLVTFPMLPEARIGSKHEDTISWERDLRALRATIQDARTQLANL